MTHEATRVVEATCRMTGEEFSDLVDTAGYGINYWCDRAVVDEDLCNYTVHDSEDDKEFVLGASALCDAILRIAFDHTRLRVGDGYRSTACTYVFDREQVDYDADFADVVIQVACFGEVVYG